MNDVPQYKTVRFWMNIALAIVGALIQAGIIPAEYGGVAAALAGAGNIGISTGKRSPTIAPLLGY